MSNKKFDFNLNIFLDSVSSNSDKSNNALRQFLGDEQYYLRMLESIFDDNTYKLIFPKPGYFIAGDAHKLKTNDVLANYSFSLKDSLFKADEFDDEDYDSEIAKGFFIEQDNSSCPGLMFNGQYNFFIQSFSENTTCNTVNSKYSDFSISELFRGREYPIEDDLTIKSKGYQLDIKGRVTLVKLQKRVMLFTPGDLESEYFGRIRLLTTFFKKYKLEDVKQSYYDILFEDQPKKEIDSNQ